jgi:hypothetical protein
MSKETQKAAARRSERIRRRKKALFKNARELGTDDRIDVAVIVYQYGRYYVSISTRRESWPPSITDIVRITNFICGTSSNSTGSKIPFHGQSSTLQHRSIAAASL